MVNDNTRHDDAGLLVGVDKARSIVRSILNQITLHDSPPMNDDVIAPFLTAKKKKKKLTLSTTTKRRGGMPPLHATCSVGSSAIHANSNSTTNSISIPSRQEHVSSSSIISSPLSESSLASSADHNNTATQWSNQYQQRLARAEMKMGHVALATLCHRTLLSTEQLAAAATTATATTAAEQALSGQDDEAENEPPNSLSVPVIRSKPSLTIDTLQYPVHMTVATDDSRPVLDFELPDTPVMESITGRKSIEPPALEYTAANAMLWNNSNNNKSMDNCHDILPPTPVAPRDLTETRELPSVGTSSSSSSSDDNGGSEDMPATSKQYPPLVDARDLAPPFDRTRVFYGDDDSLSVVEALSMDDDDDSMEEDRPAFLAPTHTQLNTMMLDAPDPTTLPRFTNSTTIPHFNDPLHNQRLSALTRGPRLQMFGSEYARFLSETPLAPERKTPRRSTTSTANSSTKSRPMAPPSRHIIHLEDASDAILTGAVTDIIVTHGTALPPNGYFRISQIPCGKVHINVKKEPNWDRAAQRPCVTALAIIFPGRQEVVPPGFCVVSLYGETNKTDAANLNHDNATAERVYLCYRRSREGNPITGLLPLLPNKSQVIPEGYTVLERSPRNHVADINTASSSDPIFLAFRQRLASLEPLRPLPLLLSVYNDTVRDNKQGIFRSKVRLKSYYCTGGTTVSANVGKFHIMDRSTHVLLSPSSIQNRLTLIQASRRLKTTSGSSSSSTVMVDEDGSTYAGSLANTMSGSHSVQTNDDSFVTEGSSGDSITPQNGIVPPRRNVGTTFFSNDDAALQQCLIATAFIPIVETPNDTLLQDTRVAILTPILTACYTQHGGAAMLAVQGLVSLLNETDFFRSDLVTFPDGEGSDARLTLLDISIQSVCDIATSTARETSFSQCIDFVKKAVLFARGHLNTRTTGYVLRFYLFVFYFGASVPTTSTAANTVWPSAQCSTRDGGVADVPFLFEDGSYLFGGAPQAAALALKELVSLLMNRLVVLSYAERLRVVQGMHERRLSDMDDADPMGNFIDGVVTSLVDNAVRRVDLANYTQLALHQIHRSGGSELFWYDMMTSCGNGLFDNLPPEAKSVHMVAFSLLANMVKVSSGKMRRMATTGQVIARDVASKLLSLEMLRHYMMSFRECVEKEQLLDGPDTAAHQRESTGTLIYAMRRLVIPCLLSNTIQGLQDARVYRRLVHIITEAWKAPMFQKSMKLELGVVVEQFAVRLLNLGPQLLTPQDMHLLNQAGLETIQKLDSAYDIFTKPLYHQQVDLLLEVNRWFQKDAQGFVEFFLNYDTDISLQNEGPNHWMPGSQWKLCERLCGAICVVAELSGNVIANQIKSSNSTNEGPLTPTSISHKDFNFVGRNGKEKDDAKKEEEGRLIAARFAARQLQNASFTAVSQMARSLAVAAAAATGREEATFVSRKQPVGEEHAVMEFDDEGFEPFDSSSDRYSVTSVNRDGDDTILSYWRTAIAAERRRGPSFPRPVTETQTNAERATDLDEYPDNNSVGTEGTADDALRAAFHIVDTKSLKKGIAYLIANDYLSPSAREVATFLRIQHSRFNAKALGEYLGDSSFDTTAIEYCNQIRFNYVRAISFVGMTVEQGLRHFLTNCGFRLPGEAQQIDRIMTTFSQCYWEDNAGDYHRCPFDDQDTIFLLSFAIIMLNTDLHKVSLPSKSRSRRQRKRMTKTEFLKNLRGVSKDDELSHEYLSEIYDSVEAAPIELFDESVVPVREITLSSASKVQTEQRNVGKMLKSMVKNVKKSDELLRGLSVHEFRFYTIHDYAECMSCSSQEALTDLSHSAFSSMWNQFHGLIKASIKIAHLDPQALVLVLPVLHACLNITICLDLAEEFKVFATQLARIKMIAAKSSISGSSFQSEEWFIDLQAALAEADRLTALEQVQELMDELEEHLQVDSKARKHITRVVRRIRNGQFLLNDPSRAFFKEGYLTKKSHRLGRATMYQFFLFSDLLLYAKPASVAPGEELYYTIHEVLSLHLMKVVDWYPNGKKQTDKNFTIHHPRKAFTVVCSTVQERKDWVSAIRRHIQEAQQRVVLLNQAPSSTNPVPDLRLSRG